SHCKNNPILSRAVQPSNPKLPEYSRVSDEQIAYCFEATSARDGRGMGSGTVHMDVHVSRRHDAGSDRALERKNSRRSVRRGLF
ncbi:MAG: hypothetical protein ACR2P1_16695, partial [Pseudomonadales bacterium]